MNDELLKGLKEIAYQLERIADGVNSLNTRFGR